MSSSDGVSRTQEFKVHACGNLYKDVEHFIGKFTSGGEVFQQDKTGWQLRRHAEEENNKRRRVDERPKVMPWDLVSSKTQTVTHTGQPELGMSASGAQMNYFVLKKEGPNYTVIPVKAWYSFRPNFRQKKVLSLEEAEQKMNAVGNNVQLNSNSRLGALAAKAELDGGEMEEGDAEGEDPDSDEERELQRAAKLKASQTEAANGGTSGAQQTPPGTVQGDKGEKGEDWEHEDEHADDDLEQGEEESDQDVPEGEKSKKPILQQPDSDEEDKNLTEEGQAINRILQKTHLSSGSDGSVSSKEIDDEDDDDDDDDDDLDLDAIASKIMPKVNVRRERSPSVPVSTDSGSKKGKTSTKASQRSTPQPSAAGTNKRKANAPLTGEEAKKARPPVKQEIKKDLSTQSEATSGPPSLKELTNCLKAWGPITASELTTRFKKRLPTKEDKKNFTANVKKVSKLEERPPGSGNKFVVLK